MNEALTISGVWRQFTCASLLQALNDGLQHNRLLSVTPCC